MAYDKEKLYKNALEAIDKDEEVVFIENLADSLGISKKTLYRHFAVDSPELHELKEALQRNKSRIKRQLRRNWLKADSAATVQIALYKLLGTKEEIRILTNSPAPVGYDDVPLIQIENYIPLTHEH